MKNNFFDKSTINIIGFGFISILEALQVLIIVVLIFSFIPFTVPPFVQKLYPLSLYDVHMKRDTLFYHIWIGTALILQGLLIFVNRHRLKEDRLWHSLLPYLGSIVGLIIVQVFAVFKILLWGNPWWAKDLFYAALGAGILVRIFWPEFRRFIFWFGAQLSVRTIPVSWGYLMDAGGILFLTVLIFTPNLSEVLARMFSYDKFYHLDSFIMSPAWAFHNGLVLNKDVISQYSLVIPIVFDGLMKLGGGFNYENAIRTMIGLSAIYYFLLYGLWRYWTGSFWLSFFALVLAIKLQFFHWGVVPLIWIYPSATPLRFLPDVFFLFFILRFTQGLQMRWLFVAAFVSGLGLVWTLDVGVYMFTILLIAGAACVYLKGARVLAPVVAVAMLPWIIALGILSIFYGTLLWHNAFWQNTFEFASLFLQGWGALPITDGLKDKQFFAFCMGFMIPVAYLGTLLYSLGMIIFRKSRPHLFMALISVYGLGLYHYFIHRSGVTSYYAVVVPLIFVLLFWLQALLSYCVVAWQRGIKIVLALWALTALTTGYLFMYYPNGLNLSGYDWTQEKKFYDQAFDFNQDAFLIDTLTAPHEPVALISSFETKILIQANRKPFFYLAQMVESEHMQGEKLRGVLIHTHARLALTLKQLSDERPSHVFIQTRLLEGPQAQSYEDDHEGFKQLMAYIRQHYQFQARGQYLTALKLI